MATVRSLAEQDLGIAVLPVFYCEDAVRMGTLVALFDGRHQVTHEIFGIYSSRRLKPGKLVVFLDFLQEVLSDEL